VAQGTPLYMAPEQARGDTPRIDRRTDVYSLGVTLYEVLTGNQPFMGAGTVSVIMKVLNEEAVPPRALDPSIPVDLETITLKCLEKDPARRYDSARALGEDLQAWLDGEPIRARSASFAYRLLKRARKHRALLVTSALLLVVGITLGGYAIKTRRAADAQARLAQQLGREVERNDALARYSALLPLHDTRRERTQIEARLESIKERMAELGSVAGGPGHWALGRGYLVLDRPDQARQELEIAWRAGYRAPEVAYALGVAYGELYRQALTDLERIGDKELGAAQRVQLERRLRDPALAYLKASSGLQDDTVEYVEGLIAFHERRYAEALDKAHVAQAHVAWQLEPFTLEGDVQVALAEEAWVRGDPDGALKSLELAGSAYRAASSVARSSVSALRGDCHRLARQAVILYHFGRNPDAAGKEAISACEAALQALPGDSAPLSDEVDAWGARARFDGEHSGDVRRDWAEALRLAQVGVAAAPHDLHALLSLTRAERMYGAYLVTQGEDPREHVDKALAAGREVLAIDPRSLDALNERARAVTDRGDWEAEHGEDPRRSYDAAVASAKEALLLFPDGYFIEHTIAITLFSKGWWELEHGIDPTASLEQASKFDEEVVRLNPRVDYGLANLCAVRESLGEYRLMRGVDPTPILLLALDDCRRAIDLDPNWPGSYLNVGCVQLVRARWHASEGLDPSELLADARSWIGRSVEKDHGYEMALRYGGLIEIFAARWALGHGRSPTDAFEAARASLERAVQSNPNSAEAHAAVAELHRWRAEWRASLHQPVAEEVALGLRAAEAALGINSRLAAASLQAGALHLIQARASRGPTQHEAAVRSLEALRHTLEHNANLERETRPLLEEATRLQAVP
jgi:serine/threonine-protein kinase